MLHGVEIVIEYDGVRRIVRACMHSIAILFASGVLHSALPLSTQHTAKDDTDSTLDATTERSAHSGYR